MLEKKLESNILIEVKVMDKQEILVKLLYKFVYDNHNRCGILEWMEENNLGECDSFGSCSECIDAVSRFIFM